MTHQMKLFESPFEKIRSRQKTIELRLNDEKRQKIQIGDLIEFTQIETKEQIMAEVIGLHRFGSFDELYQQLPLLKCGYTEMTIGSAKPEDMDKYYSREKQKEYGVLGIEIKVLNIPSNNEQHKD